MKLLVINVPAVEAAMILEVQKFNKKYKNI
jgi:hypothetical protein